MKDNIFFYLHYIMCGKKKKVNRHYYNLLTINQWLL